MSLADENKALRNALRAMNDMLFAEKGFSADEIAAVIAENDRFRAAFQQIITRLTRTEAGDQSITSACCTYCNEYWPRLDGDTADVARDQARAHAATCPKHPLRVVDTAVERLVFMLHVYNGHNLDSRGPAGCVREAIEALAPPVAAYISEHGADAAYERWFDAETSAPKRPIGAP